MICDMLLFVIMSRNGHQHSAQCMHSDICRSHHPMSYNVGRDGYPSIDCNIKQYKMLTCIV